MKINKLVLSFVLIFITQNIYGQFYADSLLHDNIYRHYRLYIPPTYADTVGLPLVFNIHGRGSTGAEQQFYSQMNNVADTTGFVVCYPNATSTGGVTLWNSGFDPNAVDDLGFINLLIDELLGKFSIDSSRIYSCGMSNGGYHSYFLACELPDRFAAIASVTGTMFPAVYNSCEPNRAMPVLQIHGTNDGTVLYNGDASGTAIEQVVKFWVENNFCASEGDTINIPDVNTADNSTAQLISYTNCDDNSEVQFYKILNGSHTWPGGAIDLYGVTNRDFNASEVIWNFFKQYSLEDQILDVVDDNLFDVKVSPNPANNVIYVNGLTKASSVKIISIKGALIKDIKNVTQNTKVDVSNLSAGLYLVNIIDSRTNKLHKLVIN